MNYAPSFPLAGALATPDLDAARWRLLEQEFGDVRARHQRYIAIPPRFSVSAMQYAGETITVHTAVKWRFECEWTDRSGSADTIPKFITYLLSTRRDETKEQS